MYFSVFVPVLTKSFSSTIKSQISSLHIMSFNTLSSSFIFVIYWDLKLSRNLHILDRVNIFPHCLYLLCPISSEASIHSYYCWSYPIHSMVFSPILLLSSCSYIQSVQTKMIALVSNLHILQLSVLKKATTPVNKSKHYQLTTPSCVLMFINF